MSYFRSTAGRVVSCVLYLIAGVFTGWLTLILMRFSEGSTGPLPTMYISLFGSSVLLIRGSDGNIPLPGDRLHRADWGDRRLDLLHRDDASDRNPTRHDGDRCVPALDARSFVSLSGRGYRRRP